MENDNPKSDLSYFRHTNIHEITIMQNSCIFNFYQTHFIIHSFSKWSSWSWIENEVRNELAIFLSHICRLTSFEKLLLGLRETSRSLVCLNSPQIRIIKSSTSRNPDWLAFPKIDPPEERLSRLSCAHQMVICKKRGFPCPEKPAWLWRDRAADRWTACEEAVSEFTVHFCRLNYPFGKRWKMHSSPYLLLYKPH